MTAAPNPAKVGAAPGVEMTKKFVTQSGVPSKATKAEAAALAANLRAALSAVRIAPPEMQKGAEWATTDLFERIMLIKKLPPETEVLSLAHVPEFLPSTVDRVFRRIANDKGDQCRFSANNVASAALSIGLHLLHELPEVQAFVDVVEAAESETELTVYNESQLHQITEGFKATIDDLGTGFRNRWGFRCHPNILVEFQERAKATRVNSSSLAIILTLMGLKGQPGCNADTSFIDINVDRLLKSFIDRGNNIRALLAGYRSTP